MSSVFFVAPYVSKDSGRDLSCTPSSFTYSDYMINAFIRSKKQNVVVLSLCSSNTKSYLTKKEVTLKDHMEVYFRCLSCSWGIFAVRITQIWLYLQIFFYLLINVNKDDTVVFYHDYGLSHFYKIYRWFIHCKFVYLVGEVYNAVYDRGKKPIYQECKRLSNADAYIYSNDILSNYFRNNRDSCVCYGNYSYSVHSKLKDGCIHVLYAGKISSGIINDAFIALEVIKFLPSEYVLHIAGYGELEDIKEIKRRIETINAQAGTVRVIYEGNLTGEKYENLLSKCTIGLCTRSLRNELSNYCFPSKTLVYLTHDILPICPQLDILTSSKLVSSLAFVGGDMTPENISKTILKQKDRVRGYNNKELLELLDCEFIGKLVEILN